VSLILTSPERSQVLWSPVLHYDPGTDVRRDTHPDAKGYAPRRARTLLFYTESTTCLRPADNGHFRTARWSPGGDIKVSDRAVFLVYERRQENHTDSVLPSAFLRANPPGV
jgi:hypothetical protein